MGRQILSGLAVAAVVGVVAAATFDALRGGEPPAAKPRSEPPPCRDGQLALDLVARDDRPVIVLRHARGPRCLAPSYDVRAEASGGLLLVQEGDPGGLFAPGVHWERTFRFQPRCDQRGPFTAVVRVGPYSARGPIAPMPCLRAAPEVVAFQRSCLRSWNGPGNGGNRAFVAEERFDHGTLFRSASATEVERCSLQLVSMQTARFIVAYRVANGRWSVERDSRAELQAAGDFYDPRSVRVRPDGTLALIDD